MATLSLKRIILPVLDMKIQLTFYHDTLGLAVKGNAEDPTYVELDAGGCVVALQSGGVEQDKTNSPKIVFYTADIATMRDDLMLMGIKLGKLKKFGELVSCDGMDPEGNPFQITNRE